MIAKEKTEQPSEDPRRKSGDAAERQMAFYLRRSFGETPDVWIFNDLRIEREGEVAQMDHLVLHPFGIIIIESKSVTGEIHINQHLEFARVFGRKKSGMPSPIEQATRQGDLLRKLLIDHKKHLRKKAMFGLIQGGFQHCPIQVLVAISDQGIIKRPRTKIPELFKADQVAPKAEEIISRHRKGHSLVTAEDKGYGAYSFAPEETDKVLNFLKSRHADQPQRASIPDIKGPSAPPPSSIEKPVTEFRCDQCQSTDLEIRFGHSYYLKCRSCDGNTPIKHRCQKCEKSTRLQKRRREFKAICQSCPHEELIFVNPESS